MKIPQMLKKVHKTVLAIDIAGLAPCIALYHQEKWFSQELMIKATSQTLATELVPALWKLLEEAGLTFSNVEHLAVTIGPGSFTGIRMGIATIQGLCIARDLPVFSATTLEVLGYAGLQQAPTNHIISALWTRREGYYSQGFDENFQPFLPAAILEEPYLISLVLKNPGIKLISDQTFDDPLLQAHALKAPSNSAVTLIQLFHKKLSILSDTVKNIPLRPYYFHEPHFMKRLDASAAC